VEAFRRACESMLGVTVRLLGELLKRRAEEEQFEDALAVLDNFSNRAATGCDAVTRIGALSSSWERKPSPNMDVRVGVSTSVPAVKSKQTEDEFWMHYFADPGRWWDNRYDKINLQAPDFKHKVTHKGLWIHNRTTSEWVKQKFL
jgi:hypothetical protein